MDEAEEFQRQVIDRIMDCGAHATCYNNPDLSGSMIRTVKRLVYLLDEQPPDYDLRRVWDV